MVSNKDADAPRSSFLRDRARRLGLRDRNDLARIPRHFFRQHVVKRVYPTFGVDKLSTTLQELGCRSGRTVVVHCSWEQFYNFDGNALTMIKLLLDLLGPDGTLIMPAYPIGNDPSKIFDVRRTPTRAGLLAETFRRYPGVKRSINFAQSVCAFGPAAAYLTEDHHKSLTSWDENSPYYRLRTLDASVIGLGIDRKRVGYGTAIHCAESILREDVPFFRLVFGAPVTYQYRDNEGQSGEHTYLPRTAKFRATVIDRYMDKQQRAHGRLSNMRVQTINAPYLIDRVVELGRMGITNFIDPAPEPSLFRDIKAGKLLEN